MSINKSKKYRIKKLRKVKKIYKIKIGTEIVTVTWKVYYAYKRPVWRESKRWKVRRTNEVSFELLRENGFDYEDINQEGVDNTVVTKMLAEKLQHILPQLRNDERLLIEELYFNGKSERAISRETGIPQTTINYRKNKIIQNIYEQFVNL